MEWRKFCIKDLFEVRIGVSIDGNKIDRTGTYAYITRKESNNALDGFVTDDADKLCTQFPVITIGNETAQPFVQEYPFFTGTKVNILSPKVQCNAYALRFVATSLQQHKSKYSYSYTINSSRLKKQIILLPVDADGNPDWAFMGAYMKQVEEEHLSEVLPKLEAQLLEHIITLGALEDREWKEFTLTDFFSPIKGNQNNMSSLVEGEFPLISAKKWGNGVKAFVSPNNKGLFPQHCITLNLDGDGGAGLAYYHEYSFALDSHVAALYPKLLLDRFCLLFIARSISAQRFRFGHGRAINKSRLSRFLIMLPIQSDGTPDWGFMSDFMKKVEQDTLSEALRNFKPKKYKRMLTGGGKIRPFFMEEILRISNGVRLTKADMTIGNRPFVGSSEACNGVTGFVDNDNASLDKEVLGVNYNGSVGFSFYHPYEALFSDDVKRVRWKDEAANNKYTLLYLSNAIAQQRSKYAYGYKFNALRMKRQIIMLPTLADGTPDFIYMDHTMRVMDYAVLFTYLKRLIGQNGQGVTHLVIQKSHSTHREEW